MSAPLSLGPFTFLSVLGEGGSAFVYAARDQAGRDVALKVLRPELELEPREVQRFVEEAGKMRRVNHPALVPVLDVGMLPDGRPYIAMPRLQGRTLAERIASGPLSVARAVALFEDVAYAVGALHDAGLVHRDLKPENVLWLDGEDRLIVLDLGIAREADAIASTTTRAGKTRGTPAYMAPERFFGRPATVASDVYELGVLLYVMLTGALPWDAEDPRGRMSPKLPAELGVLVPGPVVSVLMRALDVDFEKRPASVEALLHEVRRAAAMSAGGAVAPNDAAETRRAIVVTPPSPAAAIPPGIDPALAQAPTQVSPARGFPITQLTMPSASPPGETPPHVATLASAPPSPSRSSGAALLFAGAAIAVIAAVGGAVGVGALRAERGAPSAPTIDDATQPPPVPTPTATATEVAPSPSSSAVPSVSASPSGSASASPSPGPSSPSASPSAGPGPTPPSPSTSAGSPPGPAGAIPPACAGYIALMCDPSSGSTPAECAAARQNVPQWIALSPSVAAETCGAALSQSRTGLALRRSAGPPPTAPRQSTPGATP